MLTGRRKGAAINDLAQRLVRLRAEPRVDREALAHLADEIAAARARLAGRDPDGFEARALGSLVHDIYAGVGRALQRIAKDLNGGLPTGAEWHRDLLRQMTLDLPDVRPPVLSAHLATRLAPYLGFRHLVRNVYGFEIEWHASVR